MTLQSAGQAALLPPTRPDADSARDRRKPVAGAVGPGGLWTWAVLALGILLTAFAYFSVEADSEAAAQARFDFRQHEIVQAVERRMAAYTQTLFGALGLLRASDDVARDEWRIYVDSLDLDNRYPGIQGIGFTEWVTPERRAAYEAAIRAEGFPDFTIRPPEPRPLYSSITYLEPFDERNRQAFGFDMYAEATRRAAMELARDTGEFAVSGDVRLVQEIGSDVQAGFLLYVPYYGRNDVPQTVAERQAASVGFVYSAFRMGDLMEGILGPGLPDVRLQVFDGPDPLDDELMFDSEPGRDTSQSAFVATSRINLGQRTWTLKMSSLPAFEALLDPQKSSFVLIGGLAASLLFFGVLRSSANLRARAEALAAEMTVALEQRNAELGRSNAELEQFAYVASHDLKAPLRGIDHLAIWIEKDLGDKLEGEPKRNMSLLRGRIKRLETLLNDILDYSRAGRTSTQVESFDIAEFVAEVFETVRANRPYTLAVNTDVATVCLGRTALEQVLSNLFSNTMKHHDKGAGQIAVEVHDRATGFDIVVSDDGPGIPKNLRTRAFQMFQTLQPRDQVEGSGMGLAIVRKIVERQGGSIEMVDTPGPRGAVFRIIWPKPATESAR
ncbi:MAG: CHASE domain-containing protein [Alphaproteobacteria bacterium]